jgi:hypothetical protein
MLSAAACPSLVVTQQLVCVILFWMRTRADQTMSTKLPTSTGLLMVVRAIRTDRVETAQHWPAHIW